MTTQHPTARPAAIEVPDDGFDILDIAHAQAVAELDKLCALVARLKSHGIDAQTRVLATEVGKFFSAYGREHHSDEEKHVFPRLLTEGDPETVQAVQCLLQDHHWLEQDWREVGAQVDAVAGGQGWVDADQLSNGAKIFAGLLRAHIAFEEAYIYPQARARLDQRLRFEMGREMAARHRAARRTPKAMAPLDAAQLQLLSDKLREREATLSSMICQAMATVGEGARTGDGPQGFDLQEQSGRNEPLGLTQAIAQRTRRDLDAVQSALMRVAEGRYGLCSDCGGPIRLSRLLMQPQSQRCATCQEDFEASQLPRNDAQ